MDPDTDPNSDPYRDIGKTEVCIVPVVLAFLYLVSRCVFVY